MIDAMHAFFFHLTNHKLRNEGLNGLKVLILYQARVRRKWHRQIKNPPKAGIFDIGLIDDKVLRTLKDQIYDLKRSTIISDEWKMWIWKMMLTSTLIFCSNQLMLCEFQDCFTNMLYNINVSLTDTFGFNRAYNLPYMGFS